MMKYTARESLPDTDEENEDRRGEATVKECNDGAEGLEDELFRGML